MKAMRETSYWIRDRSPEQAVNVISAKLTRVRDRRLAVAEAYDHFAGLIEAGPAAERTRASSGR